MFLECVGDPRTIFDHNGGGGHKSEAGGRTGLGRGRTDEVEVENGR